jgi:hypothetical protein
MGQLLKADGTSFTGRTARDEADGRTSISRTARPRIPGAL